MYKYNGKDIGGIRDAISHAATRGISITKKDNAAAHIYLLKVGYTIHDDVIIEPQPVSPPTPLTREQVKLTRRQLFRNGDEFSNQASVNDTLMEAILDNPAILELIIPDASVRVSLTNAYMAVKSNNPLPSE